MHDQQDPCKTRTGPHTLQVHKSKALTPNPNDDDTKPGGHPKINEGQNPHKTVHVQPPNPHNEGQNTVPHTCCGRCVVLSGPSLHETPSDKNVKYSTTHPPEWVCGTIYCYSRSPLCQNPPNESMDEAPHVVPMSAAKRVQPYATLPHPSAVGVVISDYLYWRGRSGHPTRMKPIPVR
ncbi:hypothetical protein BS47DRAFT_1452724 [Hydnum rufescens UP504]|uniref:Uncharacterized protein n=1 Tax=Hydnum rufescens UP504 TaxID=1448309 RepID=A0A9P6DG33_9AGAM|nr:hypothetical protein BS47DRAFT_1452724 [Hydnum rufescens UP504]